MATIPAVSVVMSVCNGERFLSEAIESILCQSFNDFEFIIINDGSTDDTASFLDLYVKRDARIRVFSHRNKGLTYSLNLGCELAQGVLIARMDADDVAVKDRLLWQVRFMDANPDVGVLGGAYDLIDTNGKKLCGAKLPVEDRDIRLALLDSTAFLHPAVLMRKAALDLVGGYREVPYVEDYDLWLRLSEHVQLANLPQVLLKYRIHPGQVSVSKCREQALWTGATQVAALLRRNGERDPLDSLTEITPTALEKFGVTKNAQQSAIARGYLRYIRNMYRIGEFELASEALTTVHSDECRNAERWIIADLHLLAAKLHWRKRKLVSGALSICRAIVSRPLILGRFFKVVSQSLTRRLNIIGREFEKMYLLHRGVKTYTKIQ